MKYLLLVLVSSALFLGCSAKQINETTNSITNDLSGVSDDATKKR